MAVDVMVSQCEYRSLLQACIKNKSLPHARLAYADLVLHGYDNTLHLAEYLVVTLANCYGQEDALYVFNSLPRRSVLSWTAIIYGYMSCGNAKKALQIYPCMCSDGVEPNCYTFVSLIKACGLLGGLQESRLFHAEAIKYHCESSPFVVACLLEMYSKCGSIVDAENVFYCSNDHDVVSWTAMLTAYVEQGRVKEGLKLFRDMHMEKVEPNERSFVAVLQACCMLGVKEKDSEMGEGSSESVYLIIGKALHGHVRKKGWESNEYVHSSLITMYGELGSMAEIGFVFSQVSKHSIVSWTSIIAAYVAQNEGHKALQLFKKMQDKGTGPNERTFSSAIQGCCILAEKEEATTVAGQPIKPTSFEIAKALHVDVERNGLELNKFIQHGLIGLYGNCGSTLHAQKVFDQITSPDVISLTLMLTAYVDQGEGEKALELYRKVQLAVSADERTLLVVLQACCVLAEKEDNTLINGSPTKLATLEVGQELHTDVCCKGLEFDVFLCNALVGLYGKCGRISEAEDVFAGSCKMDVVLWTTMIMAYIEQGNGERALEIFEAMKREGVNFNETALVCVLQACSETLQVERCYEIHGVTVLSGCNFSMILANSFISSYGSCGALTDAHVVFDGLPQPNLISWTSLISSYGRQGDYVRSINLIEEMQCVGMKPNKVTFLAVLFACSHAGMVSKGSEYFTFMSEGFGLTPGVEHYVSMIDLFGRAGNFNWVESLLSSMQKQPHLAMWLCTLNSCHRHGYLGLGKQAFDLAMDLGPDHAVGYVLMSNIIANQKLVDWKDVSAYPHSPTLGFQDW